MQARFETVLNEPDRPLTPAELAQAMANVEAFAAGAPLPDPVA